MENAHIHHGAEILELAERFGAHIIGILQIVCGTDSFCRCAHYFIAPILPRFKSNRGGNLQDQSLVMVFCLMFRSQLM